MRKLSVTPLIFCLLLSLTSQALTLSESLTKLQKYSAADLETTETRTEKDVSAKALEILELIEQSVKMAMEEKQEASPELLQQLARVSVLTFQADPSEAASELLLPLYQKQKKAFDKALKSLPKKERTELEKSLKNSAREESEGNG